jgi:AsmA family protein
MNSNPPAQGARAPLQAIRRHPFLTALGVLALAILVLILIWDWNWLRGPIERVVRAQTGREFDIGGDLDVDLGRTTTVRMDAVRFGNADWSKQRDMASAQRVEFQFQLWPALLRREVILPQLRLARPRVRMEMGPEGVGNWVFGEDDPDGKPMQLRSLWIDDGRLAYLDAKARTDIDVALASRAPSKGEGAPASTAADAGPATASRCAAKRNRRWSCRTPNSRIASTCARRPAAPKRARAGRCSIRCGCATSIFSSRSRGRTWRTSTH